jgi:hypothetical protein
MADPTLVNGQITDAVTQVVVTAIGAAPAQTAVLAMQNAVSHQQAMNQIAVALVTRCVATLMDEAQETRSS